MNKEKLTSRCEICGAPCCRRNKHCMKHKPNGPKPKPLSDRIFNRLKKKDDCWEWQGSCDRKGYGKIGIGSMKDGTRRLATVTRIIWEITFGKIDPPKLFVCHKCDNPRCCNPNHLFLGTQKDNSRDMIAKGRGKKGSGTIRTFTCKLCGKKFNVYVTTSTKRKFCSENCGKYAAKGIKHKNAYNK